MKEDRLKSFIELLVCMLRDTSYAKSWTITTENLRKKGIYKRIADYAELTYGQSVLELGVGISGLLGEVCKRLNPKESLVVGIDSNQEALRISKEVLEKEGYGVNLVLKTFYENDFLFIKQNTPVQLEQGKINLIGDIYGLSKFDYLRDNKFDRIFLTFIGGTLDMPIETVGKAMDDVSEFMKDDGIFIHVDKEFTAPDKLTYGEGLLRVTNRFELIHSMFEESIEDFVTSFYPAPLGMRGIILNGTSTYAVIQPKRSLKKTIKYLEKRAKKQSLIKFGLVYSKFKPTQIR